MQPDSEADLSSEVLAAQATDSTPSRLPRLALLVWLVLLLVLTVRPLVSRRGHSVYPIFAEASRHWRAGEELYNTGGEAYRYSPTVAMLLTPLSYLPDFLGEVLWRWINAGLYLAALAGWLRLAIPRALSRQQQALIFLLVIPLSVGSLNNGQSNALVMGMLLFSVTAVLRERWNLAVIALTIAALFKIYPLALGLLFIVLYPRPMAWRLGLALMVGLLMPFVLQDRAYVIGQYASWVECLRNDHREKLPFDLWYRDLRLLCHRLHFPLSEHAYRAVQLLVAGGIAGLALAARRACWEPRKLLVLILGLACTWMTLFGVAAESCTYILLAPTLGWELLRAETTSGVAWQRWALRGSAILFLLAEMAVWFPFGRQVHSLGVQPLAALVLFGCLVVPAARSLMHGRPASGRLDPRPAPRPV